MIKSIALDAEVHRRLKIEAVLKDLQIKQYIVYLLDVNKAVEESKKEDL